jgi:hypothetical protein
MSTEPTASKLNLHAWNGQAWVPVEVPSLAADWADVREAARKAGWRSHTFVSREWLAFTSDGEDGGMVDVRRRRATKDWRVSVLGSRGKVEIDAPTPAEVLTAARLVGLGGNSDA